MPPTRPHRYHVLRHGQSVANVLGLIASRPVNAGSAYGITPEGHEQVRTAVTQAVASGALVQSWRIVSSPLLRSRQSAGVAAEVLGVSEPYVIDERLTERGFGALELTPDTNYERVWAHDRRSPDHEEWGVESVRSVSARVREVIRELERDGDVASTILCTHGDVASTLHCSSLGLPLGRHRDVGALGTGKMRPVPSVSTLVAELEERVP